MSRRSALLIGAVSLVAGLAPAGVARAAADPTYFLLEVQTGLAEPAYRSGDPGLMYGLAAGLTWKLKSLPLRFHLLTVVAGRNGHASGDVAGVPYDADRRDFDLYLAHRIAVPVAGPIRIFGEIGFGHRWVDQTVRRGGTLDSLPAAWSESLLVAGGGVQARLHQRFSLGLRLDVTPLASDADLVTTVTRAAPTPNRAALMAQLGFHF